MFIDTTTIKNVGGVDCTGRNPTDRGRLGTKISVIIDESKIALSEPVAFPANVHDSKTIEKSLNSIPFKLNKDGRMIFRMAADKAYNLKPLANMLLTRKIRLVTEPKKNARNPTPIRAQDKSMYKKRIYIEHFFGIAKRMKRLRFRMDRFIDNYTSFWFLAMARQTFHALSMDISNINPHY